VRIRAVFLAAALCAACGPSLQAGKTPKETMRRLETALQDLDLGAVYDMLSSQAQGQLDASLRGFRTMLQAIPEDQLKRAGLGGWKDLSTREYLDAAADRMRSENPSAVRQIRRLAIVVLEIRPYGDRASVKVSVLLNGRDKTQTIPLVLEDGRWKIDTDAAMTDLPVDFAPNVSDCATTFT
jgi:hypothetical protein